MAIIVGHKEDCDIVINGPVNRRPATPDRNQCTYVDEAMVCTCGGELIDTRLFVMGEPGPTWAEVLKIVAENAGGVDHANL